MANIFTYNAKGDVTNKIDNSRELGVVTDLSSTFYSYNSMGLISSTSMYSNGLAPRYSSNTYDTKGRFALTSTNTLGQTASKTYDPRWGTPLTETDITGLMTAYEYDGFGRVKKVTTPQQHNITTDYRWSYDAELLPLKCYDVVTTTPGKPQTWDVYDASGRLVVATRQSYGDVNNRHTYTYVVTEYDAKGNVARKTTPVNASNWSSEVEYTTFSYDYLNRLTSESNPTLGATGYGYSYNVNAGQSTVTVTTPAGQTSSKTTDATGKTLSTTDHGGTLTFEYDNRGNQTSVKMNGTVITSMTYDRKGHQTALTDQNSGTTQYLYDNYGQLKWQKDARNSEYTMNYDALGRLTTRTGPEGTTTNEYVTSGNGLNAIKKITSFNGILQEYTYDNWHRIETATETIEGTAFTKTFTYNAYNDLLSTTYPSGLVTTNSYSGDGYLFKVTANNGTLFDGTNGEINGLGKWRNYKLGNSVTSNITYNNFGMPTRYEASSIVAGSKQNLELNWNLQTGNLTSRIDLLKGLEENFTYDNLNRLRTATVDGLESYSFDFNDDGNTIFKSDAGWLNYDATKPNAVTAVYGNGNGTGGITIPLETQDIKYTKFQRPSQITEGDYELTFMYASDYERRKTELMHKGAIINTRYFMGDYEIDVKNGTTRYIHYISGGDGLCAIVIQDAQSGDFQYFFPYTDHLGSILTVTDDEGAIVAEQNFDAWGRKRNVDTWNYDDVNEVPAWLYRGFTGHEHLPEFGIINMNARLYDPVLGRMLSPDNYVGEGTQGFNRYSYANNNPLKFTDPSGNFVLATAVACAVIGGVLNASIQSFSGNINSSEDALKAFGMGALNGFLIGTGAGTLTGGLIQTGLSAASSLLPGYQVELGNMTIGISPAIVYGTLGIGAGVNLTFDLNIENFHVGLSYGFTQYSNNAVTGKPDFETRLGASYGYDDGTTALRWNSTEFGGANPQRVGSIYAKIAGVSIHYENDWFFGKSNGDGGDRFRTTGARIGYKDWSIGLNLFTGDPGLDDSERRSHGKRKDYRGTYLEQTDPYRLGALYVGYQNYRVGVNSELVRDQFQNKWAHGNGSIYPLFRVMNRNIQPYVNYKTLNPFTTW